MGFKIEIKGLEEMRRKLDRLKRNLKAVDGGRSVPIGELLMPAFLRAHSRFDSFEALVRVATSSSRVISSPPRSFVRFRTRRGTSGLRRRRIFGMGNRCRKLPAPSI